MSFETFRDHFIAELPDMNLLRVTFEAAIASTELQFGSVHLSKSEKAILRKFYEESVQEAYRRKQS